MTRNTTVGVSPRATYRIQLHQGFDFYATARLTGYLAELGISHLYSSPCLQAIPGSTHGYDVVDPTRVNADLGGAGGHERLGRTLQEYGLGWLLDIVPNHMAISQHNRWWWDLLENGIESQYADYFDVDRQELEGTTHGGILLPLLGDHYGRVLEAGDLRLLHHQGVFQVAYYEHRFPLAPSSLGALLDPAARLCGSDQLALLADAFTCLPHLAADPERRHRDKQALWQQFTDLLAQQPETATAVDNVVATVNADVERLDALLNQQNYRLAYWRAGASELGYRRFFDIDTLIRVRQENESVFRDSHRLVLDWISGGRVDGLRVDHPDGLRDPEQYLHRLRNAAPHAWLLVEKILEPDESLRADWPVAGTTGYDFLNQVGGLFIDGDGEQPLTELYIAFTGEQRDYRALLFDKKHQVLRKLLGSEVVRLTALLYRLRSHYRRHRDHTWDNLQEAITAMAACFPVYRSYVQFYEQPPHTEDQQRIHQAAIQARHHHPWIDAELINFLEQLLLAQHRDTLAHEFLLRFQQLTVATMAKGAEDTAFYCYNRLLALNEVGGAPDRFGTTVEAFHRTLSENARQRPGSLLATTTHDTKRSEDIRARLAVLSEMPFQWREAVYRWSAMNEQHRSAELPDRNTEYLLYQTLVGAWPITRDRAQAYMTKAAREAKTHTRWRRNDLVYEQALCDFIEAVLSDEAFIAELEAFVATVVEPGRVNALAQTLIKLTAPGVPDIYQGTELWDLSLVDPDNRRPVDYELRRHLMAEMQSLSPEAILERSDEGLPKLWLMRQALHLRRVRPHAFSAEGDYAPVTLGGRHSNHVVAFTRGGHSTATIVPRLVTRLAGDWGDTALDLPGGEWHNELTGEWLTGGAVPLTQLLARFPVALLAREGAQS